MADTIRRSFKTNVFGLFLMLLALSWMPVESDTHLRKRVYKEGANNEEFGRSLKLFLDESRHRVTKQRTTSSNKSNLPNVDHHHVDVNQREEMSNSIDNDMETAAFEARVLDFMSLSMSMESVPTEIPTEVPTDVPTETPILVRLPAPTSSPSYVPTYAPSFGQTLYPTVALTTPAPFEYLEPTSSPTYAPTLSPSTYIAQSLLPTPYLPGIPTSSPSMYYAQTLSPTMASTPLSTKTPTPSPSVYIAQTPSATVFPITYPTVAPTLSPNKAPYSDAALSPNTYPPSANAPNATVRVLSLQQQIGVCSGPSNGVGCASESDGMQGGNPNDIVNCFSVTEIGLSPPFQLTATRFWVGDSAVPPEDLSIQVWAGTVADGPTAINLYSQALNGFVSGENTVRLDETLLLFDAEFCVGVRSDSMDDGLRIQTDGGQSDHSSYLMSPRCGLPEFKSLGDIAGPGDFCIEAMVMDGSR
jgi:hypothetical protein